MKQLTCLLGSPVSHSKSPLMHNEAFSQLNLNYIYKAFDVNTEQLEEKISELRSQNARGFNLTMPNKTDACKYCDKLSPAAQIIGSINTVVNDHGVLTGYATDGIGFMRSLEDFPLDMTGKKMTILGAGGAATAIFVQAALDGVSDISIFSRKGRFFDRALQIIDKLKESTNCKLAIYELNDANLLRREINTSTLLVNATSVGMAPDTDRSLITDITMFHKDLFVSDIIYNPSETQFLKLAREAGCQTQNGLNMLLYQGAEAFRLWTGKEMPVDLIKEKYF